MTRFTGSLLCCVLLALAGCHAKAPAPRQELPPQTVTTTAVAQHDVAGTLTASGRLVPREEIAVAADLSGYRVASVLVEEGTSHDGASSSRCWTTACCARRSIRCAPI